ncbi:MAG TPA: hypothetical protein VGN57_22375 [Pirellulaceae bacterium]|nr:hypothetical protein [Pirellulaceae bacterium]
MPDGTQVEFVPMPPDADFAKIFQSSCRRPPGADELATVARYSVNVGLSGPGGSIESALKMMQAGAAIVRAGGAGVFIDNSALAHGGSDWIAMTDDGSPDAISFAFASIVRGRQETYTMGMHAIGFPDLAFRSSDVDDEGDAVVAILRYLCDRGQSVEVGHAFADERRLRFQVVGKASDDFDADSPMHNPFGRLKIVSVEGLAAEN